MKKGAYDYLEKTFQTRHDFAENGGPRRFIFHSFRNARFPIQRSLEWKRPWHKV
jgi:hypothetical protein